MKHASERKRGAAVGSSAVVSLRQVQENPALLHGCGPTSLAWLAHEAESYEPDGDDVTLMHIDSVLMARQPTEYRMFKDEYMRLWPEHAAYRGYGKQANVPDQR